MAVGLATTSHSLVFMSFSYLLALFIDKKLQTQQLNSIQFNQLMKKKKMSLN